MAIGRTAAAADWRCYLGLVLGATAFLSAGCSQTGLPLGKVSGQVTVDGKPVKEGVILFVPKRGPSASGPIEQGRYRLTTRSPGDGAVIGQHDVYFSPKPPAGDAISDAPEEPVLRPSPKSEFPPSQYTSPESAELMAEVRSGANNLDFDLKSTADTSTHRPAWPNERRNAN